jgi:hypothetical protein
VKNDYFQWQKIDDIQKATMNLLILVFFDVVSLVISVIVTQAVCKINMFQVYLFVMKQFGLVFAIHQTYLLDYQFCIVEGDKGLKAQVPYLTVQLPAPSTSPSSWTGCSTGSAGTTSQAWPPATSRTWPPATCLRHMDSTGMLPPKAPPPSRAGAATV